MDLRSYARSGLWALIFGGVAGLGCQTLGAAQGAVKDTTGAIKQGEGDTKQGIQDTKDRKAIADKKKDDKGGGGGGGGEAKEDPDGTRLGAVQVSANVAVNDELNPDKGDRVDWKKLELLGRSGYATFQVNWDDPAADLTLDIYNEDAVNIAASPKRAGNQTGKKVLVAIDQPGIYYVKIASLQGGTVYTFRCKWNGPSGRPAMAAEVGTGSASPAAPPAAPPPAAPPPAAANGGGQIPPPAVPTAGAPAVGGAAAAGGTASAGAPAAAAGAPPAPAQPQGNSAGVAPPEGDPMHPRARVVQSYRDDDGSLVIYIDRGSGSNIRAGMAGHLLLGADGDKLLEGGDFRISRVVDATRSIGRMPRSGRTSLGAKNNRCVIHLVRWP